MSAALALRLDGAARSFNSDLAHAFPVKDYYSGAVSLQRHVPNDTTCDGSDVLQDIAPLQSPKSRTGSGAMYSANNPRTFGKLVAGALWRRINSSAITRKQLQHAIGVSSGTVDNLLSGQSDPSGRVLMALITFFDASFANEILAPTGCTVAKLSDARAASLRKVAEGMAELQQAEG